jgi:hypothetical protein
MEEEQESCIAFQDKQARSLGSWELLAVGFGVGREAEPPIAAEVVAVPVSLPAVFATTFPARAQGFVGRVLPPRAEYADGLAVDRYSRQVSKSLSKTEGCQTVLE